MLDGAPASLLLRSFTRVGARHPPGAAPPTPVIHGRLGTDSKITTVPQLPWITGLPSATLPCR